MKIDTIKTNNVSFGKALVIKTKGTAIVNILEDVDFANWRLKANPKLRFEHIGLSGPDADGFHRGLLLDKEEKNLFLAMSRIFLRPFKQGKAVEPELDRLDSDVKKYLIKTAETVEISTVDELLRLPMLESVKKLISKAANDYLVG